MKRSLGPSSGQSALAKPGDCRDITARLGAGTPSPATWSPRPP